MLDGELPIPDLRLFRGSKVPLSSCLPGYRDGDGIYVIGLCSTPLVALCRD